MHSRTQVSKTGLMEPGQHPNRREQIQGQTEEPKERDNRWAQNKLQPLIYQETRKRSSNEDKHNCEALKMIVDCSAKMCNPRMKDGKSHEGGKQAHNKRQEHSQTIGAVLQQGP
ncbi:hypothetical protein NDU88_001341 [Pleurodeles waltl]|uniref:Uncharacterized protein n=1 Tax=Pleurodeles waltl TaxID=8319 RepID=A0AAV7M0W7_PLEWA|nr:hypothetical protein NDU88_001341 [Pleurodeles waltl]